MANILVLGAGMVGRVIAADLAMEASHRVTIADVREGNLAGAVERARAQARTVTPHRADLSDPAAVTRLAAGFDMVVGALSSRIGFAALGAVIDAGKNYVDISFMGEDFAAMNARAKAKGVTCVVDCGVAPGMSHILSAHLAAMLEPCETIEIYVGGLPRERRWPFEYKAAFAPSDVIEEYTRPARLVEHGKVVTREALSEPELLDFAGVGTLEAFNTDGLRSLTTSLSVPFMKEKTLRYPGHIELMRVMRETGLFSQEPIKVGDAMVRPLDLTSTLMFPKWTYQPGEEDLTVMRVLATGVRKDGPARGSRVRVVYDLFDLYHRATQATSMSRTTAFPAAIVAREILAGRFRQPGVNAPEAIAASPGLVERILAAHTERAVTYTFREERIS
jgi:saccharopine dehydrogenase-like NADP-dependent oxidoreductase